MKWIFLFIGFFLIQSGQLRAQQISADSIMKKDEILLTPDEQKIVDSLRRKRIKRAIVHSAILPGWGQVNNRQVWKLPFVGAAVGIPVGVFFYNLNTYKELRQAYIYKVDTFPANDALIPQRFSALSANSLKNYRDEFRRNLDYSVLVFLLAWGLNVADAAVYAHLRDFDVSDRLTMRVKPEINLRSSGLALVLNIKPPPKQAKEYWFMK